MRALPPFVAALLALGSTACGGRSSLLGDAQLEAEQTQPASPSLRPTQAMMPSTPAEPPRIGGTARASGGTSAGGGASSIRNPTGSAGQGGTRAQPPDRDPPPGRLSECASLVPLDPYEVYLIGTLEEGTCGRDALAHWSDPNTALVGFACANDPTAAIIRPYDFALVLDESFGPLRVFNPDGCFRNGSQTYPSDPAANDELVVFPCANVPSSLARAMIAPRGHVAFECSEGTWHATDGSLLYSGDPLGDGFVMAYEGDFFLTIGGVYDITAQTLYPFDGPPRFAFDRSISRFIASRVHDSGFRVVVGDYAGFERAELWQIDPLGQGMLIGIYPAPPPRASFLSPATLAGDGTLFQFGKEETATDNDLIVRRGVSGLSEIVYEEAANPLVRVHISGLITGP